MNKRDDIGVPEANLELVDIFLGLRAAALRFFSLVACWTKWLKNGSAHGSTIKYRELLTCKDSSWTSSAGVYLQKLVVKHIRKDAITWHWSNGE